MTAHRFANVLGAATIGAGIALGVLTCVLNPPLAAVLVIIGNAAVAIWWGIHIMVTKRPW